MRTICNLLKLLYIYPIMVIMVVLAPLVIIFGHETLVRVQKRQ